MTRAFLVATAGAWVAAGLAGLGLAVIGADAIRAILPPLAIDGDALSRTVAALAVAALVVGSGHAAIAIGLRRDRSWATSAGILLAGVSVAGFTALAAASLTAGAAGSMVSWAALLLAVGALAMALAYGLAGAALVHRLRSRPPA